MRRLEINLIGNINKIIGTKYTIKFIIGTKIILVMQEIIDIDPKYKYVKGKQRKDTVVVVTKVKKQNLKNLFLILVIIFAL